MRQQLHHRKVAGKVGFGVYVDVSIFAFFAYPDRTELTREKHLCVKLGFIVPLRLMGLFFARVSQLPLFYCF